MTAFCRYVMPARKISTACLSIWNGSDCLSRVTINEWFRRFEDGREHLTDDERSGRRREALSESNIEKVGQFEK